MVNQPLLLPWDEPGWHDQAEDWITAQLAANGWHATGPVETVHQRIWSVFMRIPTDKGTVFFKAPAPPFMRHRSHRRWPAGVRTAPPRCWGLTLSAAGFFRRMPEALCEVSARPLTRLTIG